MVSKQDEEYLEVINRAIQSNDLSELRAEKNSEQVEGLLDLWQALIDSDSQEDLKHEG